MTSYGIFKVFLHFLFSHRNTLYFTSTKTFYAVDLQNVMASEKNLKGGAFIRII